MCCNQCNPCTCGKSSVTNNITSDQAGRDGASAKALAIKVGKFPVNGTDEEFVEWNRGPKGDSGAPGNIYTKTDW